MNGEQRGSASHPWNFKVGAVENRRLTVADGGSHTVQPPASRTSSCQRGKVTRGCGGTGKSLVRHQHESIFREAAPESQREFRDVAAEATGGEAKRSGVQRGDHGVRLLVLQFPIVIEALVIMGNPAFIFGIVEAVSGVNQHCRTGADHLVAVRHAGRNQNLPGAETAHIERIAAAKGLRFRAQIDEHNLKHSHCRSPAIGLVAVMVKGLDDTRIVERSGDLGGLQGERGRESKTHALYFQEVTTVIGPDGEGCALDAGDERSRIGRQNHIANAMFALIQPIVPVAAEAFLDYRLNAMSLSGLEIEALRIGQPLATKNKRELAEWEEKKKRLGLSSPAEQHPSENSGG